jgi:polysaccharide biosynthesis/export protein
MRLLQFFGSPDGGGDRARSLISSGPRSLSAVLLGALLLPSSFVHAQSTPDYRLQAGDEVEVSVWEEEDLKRNIKIRPDGKISFPLVTGEIVAAGRTVTDIQQELTQKLARYIPEAVVTVSVIGIDGNRVYVIGQVNTPGTFVMNPRLNVLQALALAGGTTAFAALNDIIVIRGRGANQRVFQFGYDDIKRGRNLEQNMDLESGDVVIVP